MPCVGEQHARLQSMISVSDIRDGLPPVKAFAFHVAPSNQHVAAAAQFDGGAITTHRSTDGVSDVSENWKRAQPAPE